MHLIRALVDMDDYIVSLISPVQRHRERLTLWLQRRLHSLRAAIEYESCAVLQVRDHALELQGGPAQVTAACAMLQRLKMEHRGWCRDPQPAPSPTGRASPEEEEEEEEDDEGEEEGSSSESEGEVRSRSGSSGGGVTEAGGGRKREPLMTTKPHRQLCRSPCLDRPSFSQSSTLQELRAEDARSDSAHRTPPTSTGHAPLQQASSESRDYQTKMEFALKLGYSGEQVESVLSKLGSSALINDVLAELVRLGNKGELEVQAPVSSTGLAPRGPGVKEAVSPEASLEEETTDTYDNLRPIVIDGSNVAMSHGNKEVFSCLGIQLAVDWFLEKGHKDITVFVPAWRKEQSRPDAPITVESHYYDHHLKQLDGLGEVLSCDLWDCLAGRSVPPQGGTFRLDEWDVGRACLLLVPPWKDNVMSVWDLASVVSPAFACVCVCERTSATPGWKCGMPSLCADQEILRKLEKEKILVFTPSRRVQGRRVVCYDDRFIVKLACDSDGIIVSNDNYRDLQNEKPEWKKFIEERLLMYSFVNDKYAHAVAVVTGFSLCLVFPFRLFSLTRSPSCSPAQSDLVQMPVQALGLVSSGDSRSVPQRSVFTPAWNGQTKTSGVKGDRITVQTNGPRLRLNHGSVRLQFWIDQTGYRKSTEAVITR
ncbi:hypothetical protein NFI96_007265 [Prochilodus magdalenae]|nr:hypothetical protein NFI96_007265 [Prochilodus magdalenae]